MAARDANLWWNLPLPGAGLILAGHLGSGLGAALPALVALAVGLGAALVATPGSRGAAVGICVVVYVALAAVAAGIHVAATRRRPLDEALVRSLHAEAAKAYLAGQHAAAVASARRLTTAAAGEPGAWRLLALVAQAAGDAATAARAGRRAERLERLAEEAAA